MSLKDLVGLKPHVTGSRYVMLHLHQPGKIVMDMVVEVDAAEPRTLTVCVFQLGH